MIRRSDVQNALAEMLVLPHPRQGRRRLGQCTVTVDRQLEATG